MQAATWRTRWEQSPESCWRTQMSAASFISMAGSIYLLGYDGLAYIMG